MGSAALIWLGILAWFVLAIVVGLTLARVISLRDRQRPQSTEPAQSAAGRPVRLWDCVTGGSGKS